MKRRVYGAAMGVAAAMMIAAGVAWSQQTRELAGPGLMPLEPRAHMFKITDGAGAGRTVQLTLTQRTDAPEWILQLDRFNRLYLRRGEGGAVLLTRIDLLDENKMVVYEPDLPLVPATVRPGEAFVRRARATVYELDTGEQTRTGHVKHELERVARATFHTPVGKIAGYYVQIDHRISFDMAELVLEIGAGFEPGQGLVYRQMRYTIEKLGIFDETSSRTAALAE